MSGKDVPNKNSDEHIFGNMIIESDINKELNNTKILLKNHS